MGQNVPYATIREYFQNYEFTDDEIELSVCEAVLNIRTFVESHIAILDANSGKKVCMPYYSRLLKMYKLLNVNWNDKENHNLNKK